MGKTQKRISAVIACYRDAEAIPIMYQRLADVCKALDCEHEIIFVNDCSPDNTREVLKPITEKDSSVVAIHHTRNFGSQSAFSSGMRIATGDAVVLLDGDLQDPPEIIKNFYAKWQEGYDVVYGERVKREATLFLQIAYKAFYKLFRAASYVRIPVDAGDFSLMDRKVVNELNRLPESNRFLRGLRAWVGFKQTGVPYVRPERMFGRSTNNLVKNLGWARRAIISFSYAPLDFITTVALFMGVLSVLGVVVQVLVRLIRPDLVPVGFTTLIILIMLIGSIQLFCLSIIGSYLAHIYDEVKQRPSFIVEEIWNEPKKVEKA